MRYLGVDLHKREFTVCYMDSSEQYTTKNYQMFQLRNFIQSLKPSDIIAVESTTNSYYFLSKTRPFVKEVKEVNPFQFKVISSSVKKTDAHDAYLIALFLKNGLLPEVRQKTKEEKEILLLAKTRDSLVKDRTALINRIHAALCACGIELKKEGLMHKKNLEGLLELPMDEFTKTAIKSLVPIIITINGSLKELEKEIVSKGKTTKGFECINSIKGVGDLSSTILLAVIGNIDDFKTPNKLDSYIGLVPSVRNSADTERSGRITKRGNKLARTVLIQCAYVVIRYSPYFKSFYEKLKAKKGNGKAIVATARKLLNLIYYTLKKNWVFEDFAAFKKKEKSEF